MDDLIDLTPQRPRRPFVPSTSAAPAGDVAPSVPLGGALYGTTADAELGVAAGDGMAPSLPPLNARREDLSYIWGTGIAVELFRDAFRHYLETFEPPPSSAAATASNRPPVSSRHQPPAADAHLTALAFPAAPPALSSTPHTAYYIKELVRIHLQGSHQLELDLSWMQATAPAMYEQVITHPTECLQMMNAVAEELYRDVLAQRQLTPSPVAAPDDDDTAADTTLNVAPKHLPSLITLKQLSPQHVEQLLSIKGMVIRVSKIIPEIRVACFRCWHCQYTERSVSGDKGRIFEPTRCAHCGKLYSFQLQHNLSLFEDKQLIKLQESPEHVSDGETPVSISVVVYGGLVDAVVPGDRVIVTGVYRAVPIRLNANTRIIKSVFATHVDAVHIESLRAAQLAGSKVFAATPPYEGGIHGPSQDPVPPQRSSALNEQAILEGRQTARLDLFHKIAQRADIYDLLLRSFAPAVWGHEDVKRGMLAQLFGGTPKKFSFNRAPTSRGGTDGAEFDTALPSFIDQAARDDLLLGPHHSVLAANSQGGSNNNSSSSVVSFRSELNLILCGDPGVAKSQLLSQVHAIAPRGVYTSGKGSSSVGLTAFVVQDTDTGELVLEPGALVLSDRGLCCIDEFDKMNDATRSVLHEVMEQQTLSIAKAGIIAQLNARTSILAAANPKDSQWNTQLSVVENLQLEPTLLSRFDLIFVLLDRHDAHEDRRLAAHVLSLYESRSGADVRDEGSKDAEYTTHDTASQPERRGLVDAASPTTLALATVMDDVTGRAVEVRLQREGEVFLFGPAEAPRMPPAILSEYLAVARDTVFPRLTEASHKQLAASYVELRRARGSGRTVSATLRQLESMIRLAEAHAKMRYGQEVTVEDVLEAKRLISAALKESATDPRTGRINLDIFHAPDPTRNSVEGNMQRLSELIERRYVAQSRYTVSVTELRNALNEQMTGTLRPLSPNAFIELLSLMSGGDAVHSFTATTVTLSSDRDKR